MRKAIFAAMAISGLGLFALPASVNVSRADETHAMTGVLIDNACGAGQKDEAAAESHPMSCAKKEKCAASGYQLIVGDKHYKLDDNGNKEAKAYLADATTTHVTIEGELEGDKLEVKSIKAAGMKKD